ncbi:MAG: hypothetical protein JWN35_2061 [Frankiales bacterium]|jgi:hypothetical protein|nr:hypothetical protein [Frankiales bacterium]
MSGDELAEWVARSCMAQGLPVKVSEARTVEQVRVLLTGQAGRTAPARQRGRCAPAGRSQPPDRPDPGGVEGLGAGRPWSDDRVVEHGADDRGLPGQVQSCPRIA